MQSPNYPDAIALLKADHRKVEELFEKFENARTSNKRAIAEQICNELKVHAAIEEEIFYPAVSGEVEADTMNEAYVEHDSAKVLINDIMAASSVDDLFEAKVKVLSEEIRHHVHEEEMRVEGMFAQARDKGVDLVALRDTLIARKDELMALVQNGGLPPAELRVLQV